MGKSFSEYDEMPGTDRPLTPEEAEEFCRKWEQIRQYPRRVVDRQEVAKFRYLTPEEQAWEDAVDPCPTCICTRYMEKGYCQRPCKARLRHEAYINQYAKGVTSDGEKESM